VGILKKKKKKKKNRIYKNVCLYDALPVPISICTCTPVPYLPLLFQGVSASDLPTFPPFRKVLTFTASILNSIDGIHTRSISFYFGEKAPGINVELIQKYMYVANDLESIGNNFTQAMRSKSFSRKRVEK
jgi:hypothetical protein